VEEIVGELVDEHDIDPVPFDDEWELAGDTPVDEAERRIGFKLPEGDYETISGLIIHQVGDLPDAGQRVELHLAPTPAQLALDPDAPERVVTFEVLEVTRHVPSRVRIVQGEEVSR